MNYEDRLRQAKQEKSFSDAPILRRAVMRTRWFGLIGGILLMISAVRGLITGAEVLDETVVPMVVASIEAILAVSIFALSRMINSAADRYDLGRLFSLMGRLKAVLIAQLVLIFGAVIYVMILVGGAGSNPLPFVLLPLISTLLIFIWIRDITRARPEILVLTKDGIDAPFSPAILPRAKMDYVRFFGLIIGASAAAAALCAGLFWYLATYRLDWFSEHMTDKPLGLIEPFEAYDRHRISSGSISLWDQWAGDLYMKDTGNPNPHLYPNGIPDENDAMSGDEAYVGFNRYMEENPRAYATLNRKVMMFDFAGYFVIFSAIGAGAGMIFGNTRPRTDVKAVPPPL